MKRVAPRREKSETILSDCIEWTHSNLVDTRSSELSFCGPGPIVLFVW